MNKPVNPVAFAIAAAASLPGADGAPAWIMVLPAGTFTLRDGRGPFTTGDQAELQAVIARSLDHAGNTELMLDYDHQSVFGAIPNVGGTAPASGWIKQLEARPDGIWARVQWTDAAAARIKAGEYRYISPLFTYDKAGNVGRLINAALVNMPAIDFTAIAAALEHSNLKETPMKKIALALGLADTAGEDAILAAMSGNNEKLAVAAGLKKDATFEAILSGVTALVAGVGQVAVAAGLQVGATAEQIAAAASALRTAGADTVPKASFDKLSSDFKALQDTVTNGEVTRVVAAAMEAGKVTPAQKDWATAYAKRDLAGFNDFVGNAPVLTGAQLGDKSVPGTVELDATELAAAATTYQREQAAAGVTISYAEAVLTVRDKQQKK